LLLEDGWLGDWVGLVWMVGLGWVELVGLVSWLGWIGLVWLVGYFFHTS
jgi:hypothetical protein